MPARCHKHVYANFFAVQVCVDKDIKEPINLFVRTVDTAKEGGYLSRMTLVGYLFQFCGFLLAVVS